jgi:DNA-binding MarR family transcriptional regulator
VLAGSPGFGRPIADKELTAGELRTRGYYLGSNVSYNGSNVSYKVKKLVETGYLHHARSRIDRRAVRISLTDKGHEYMRSSPPLRQAYRHRRANRRHQLRGVREA